MKQVIIVGTGNAALCAGIAALEAGANVRIVEKASEKEAGGNSKYTAGAMRFVYENHDEILPLLMDKNDSRLDKSDFGSYSREKFQADLLQFNDGLALSLHQHILIDQSYDTMLWLKEHGVHFEPIYSRQSFIKNGKHIFWGGLTLAAHGEGVGLVEAEMKRFIDLGGRIDFETEAIGILMSENKISGLRCRHKNQDVVFNCDSVVLGCGGFEASQSMREKYMGKQWKASKVRGTRHNLGGGLEMALQIGAKTNGNMDGCHAVPMDAHMPDYGNLDIPFIDRKNYRKICYFLGIMINKEGHRFVDEGINFRNYTYAQFGRAILKQTDHMAWQIFDSKVEPLLYNEYRFWDAHYLESNTLDGLISQIDQVDKNQALKTIMAYNIAVDQSVAFDPTILDGKSTGGLDLNKTNWANTLDTPPYKAFPVTCGITFTYGGLLVDENAAVLNQNDHPIEGLYACGEMVGGVFYYGYPGGSGLTSGAVFGRIAGRSAAINSLS